MPIRPGCGTVGGVIHPQIGSAMDALVVFQAEDNSNTAGHWANQPTSYVAASLLDTASTNGTFGPRFTVYSSTVVDCERPAVNKVAIGNDFSWACAFQTFGRNLVNDDWDILVKLVTDDGLVTIPSWSPAARTSNGWHKFGPIVEGTSGRYAIVFTAADLATLPGFWRGRDLDIKSELGLFPDEERRGGAYEERARDRRALIEALEREGVLGPAAATRALGREEATPELIEAAYRFLARSRARLLAVQIEDQLFQRIRAAVLAGYELRAHLAIARW